MLWKHTGYFFIGDTTWIKSTPCLACTNKKLTSYPACCHANLTYNPIPSKTSSVRVSVAGLWAVAILSQLIIGVSFPPRNELLCHDEEPSSIPHEENWYLPGLKTRAQQITHSKVGDLFTKQRCLQVHTAFLTNMCRQFTESTIIQDFGWNRLQHQLQYFIPVLRQQATKSMLWLHVLQAFTRLIPPASSTNTFIAWMLHNNESNMIPTLAPLLREERRERRTCS